MAKITIINLDSIWYACLKELEMQSDLYAKNHTSLKILFIFFKKLILYPAISSRLKS